MEADWKRTLSDLDKPHAPPEERFRAGRSFLVVQQNLPAHLREQELERLKRITRRNRSLIPELYVLRRELAERFGSPSDLLEQLSREWEGGRGNYYAGETMIQIFLQQKRYEELGRFLNDYLADAHFNEKAWDQLGRRLLVAKQYELAARVFSELRARAQGDPVRVFLLAEALSQSGKQDAADALVSSIKGITLFDPQKHIDLAEFYLKTGRPFDAKAHLLASPVDVRTGAAWTHAMERFLERKNFAEARACLLYAIDSPQAVPARVLADYYVRSGEMAQLDPPVNEFDLPPRQFRDLQIEIASRLLSVNDIEGAWLRIESIDSLLDDAQGRRLLQMVEHTDWNRAEKLWANAESFLWDARCAGAQFYVRRAQAAELPATVFKDLQRAHQLHPGSFSIARAYVDKLLQQNDPAAARKVLRDVIDGYAEPGDRLAARQSLASLQASPSLPKRP